MRVVLGLLFAVTFLAGCTPPAHLTYRVDNIPPVRAPRLPVTLRVDAFRDVRRAVRDNEILFEGSKEQVVDDKRRCVNSEHGYESGAVPREVSQAIASHIARRGLMRVRADPGAPADYVLRGDLRRLYGMQDFHWGSAIGAHFGLIGAAATADNHSRAQIWIEFDALTLSDGGGRVLAKLPPVRVRYQGELPIDAQCLATYENVKNQFKIAVGRLAVRVEEAIRRVHHGAVAAARPAAGNVSVPRSSDSEDAWRQGDGAVEAGVAADGLHAGGSGGEVPSDATPLPTRHPFRSGQSASAVKQFSQK